jgi:exosortase
VKLTKTWFGQLARGHYAFALLFGVSVLASGPAIRALVVYSLNHESCSHILLVPMVSACLLLVDRRKIFSAVRPSPAAGLIILLTGAIVYRLALRVPAIGYGNSSLSLATLGLVIIWIGGFLGVYGLEATRKALFPLLFLVLMVPLPDRVLAWTISVLQEGSTVLSYGLFHLLGVPVLRQGFVLSLPSVTIEVASECSGIRSSIALFITCLLTAHLYLRTSWKILGFLLLVFPLALIKNAVRIVTLTLLSIYVDPSFLRGSLHQDGGFVFFALALLLLLPVFVLLQKSERPRVAAALELE